jgi:hypothetical protein
MDAKRALEHGIQYPYDDRQPVDAAHRAALGILAELTGRGGIGDQLDCLDDDLKIEIVDAMAEIVREAGLRG